MKIYADTSVFGGVFDEQFAEPSRKFFDEVSAGRYELAVSVIVREEIKDAPANVRDFYHAKIGEVEIFDFLPEAQDLQEAYLAADVVTPKSATDAGHVAMATVLACRMIVSWNFKHIVHFDKIQQYNIVNELNGYNRIDIFSPLEVVNYGNP